METNIIPVCSFDYHWFTCYSLCEFDL